MSNSKLKEYLIQIADNVAEKTQMEDIYQQLSLLADIDEPKEEETRRVISHLKIQKN